MSFMTTEKHTLRFRTSYKYNIKQIVNIFGKELKSKFIFAKIGTGTLGNQ